MTKITTFYLVLSSDGLEGSFTTAADARAYLNELRGIGVAGLRIDIKQVPEDVSR